jgi:hypothetical protein
MASTFKLFLDKMGGKTASTYIGKSGEVFFDPTTGTLRLSNGTTPGGTVINFYDAGNIRLPGNIYGSGPLTITSGDNNDDLTLTTGVNGGSIVIGDSNTNDITIGDYSTGAITRIRTDKFSFISIPPSSSKGQEGDEPGMIAFNASYVYLCVGTYTVGLTDIWKRIPVPTQGAW